jgi:carbonic anhydrase
MGPADVIARLAEGNRRFAAGVRSDHDFCSERTATATEPFPMAMVLSCIDSRVPAEIIFDLGLGDILHARIAGNLVNPDVVGSMELACKLAGVKVILVMGHTDCAAVRWACEDVRMGSVTALLSHLRPAIEAVRDVPGEHTSRNAAFVDAVTRANVRLAKERIAGMSPILREMAARGEIAIVAGLYDVRSGLVEFGE